VRSSPERRRLRFSFQINNVKDPEPKLPEPPLGGTTRLAPDVGGGGYLSNLEFRVKSFFTKRSEPIQQTNPEANPVDRGDLLEKAANPSQEEFPKKLFLDLKKPASNSCELSTNSPETRLLVKANPVSTSIFTEIQINLEVEYFTEPWNS
jgi:hypothetical protein